jgi:hypothetical protein
MSQVFTLSDAQHMLAHVPLDAKGQARFVRVLFEGPAATLKSVAARLGSSRPDSHCVIEGRLLTVYLPAQLTAPALVSAHGDVMAAMARARGVLEVGFEVGLAETLTEAVRADRQIQDIMKPGATFCWKCRDGLWAHGLLVAGSSRLGAFVDLARARTVEPDGLDWSGLDADQLLFGTPRPVAIRAGDVVATGSVHLARFVEGRLFVYRAPMGWAQERITDTAAKVGMAPPSDDADYHRLLKTVVDRGLFIASDGWIAIHLQISPTGKIKEVRNEPEARLERLADAPMRYIGLTLEDLESAVLGQWTFPAALTERAFPVRPDHPGSRPG